MLSPSLLISALALTALALPTEKLPAQQPLISNEEDHKIDLIEELEKAEVIPTVLDAFNPKYTLAIFWENATAEVGNTVSPSRLQKAPSVQLLDTTFALPSFPPSFEVEIATRKHTQLVIALTDPDAPSRTNPAWSQICHWLLTLIPITHPGLPGTTWQVEHLVEYKPPGPPPKTGKHRYVFAALAPANGTTKRLDLSTPGHRKHWGFEGEGDGLREWASENGLGVVGANFVYAQNEKR